MPNATSRVCPCVSRGSPEIAIGRELSSRYATETRPLTPEEQGLEKYVRRIGGNVAVRAHRHLPYSFTVLPDHNMVNAFSLPGWPMYIGEGMLDWMTNEDELACVLAHEVEHIDDYHSAERVQIEAQVRKLDLDAVGALVAFRWISARPVTTKTRSSKPTAKACISPWSPAIPPMARWIFLSASRNSATSM